MNKAVKEPKKNGNRKKRSKTQAKGKNLDEITTTDGTENSCRSALILKS